MKNKQVKLKLITSKQNYSGYVMSNIKEVLGEKKFGEFKKWIHGETVGLYNGEEYVYKHDFERFLAGLSPLD